MRTPQEQIESVNRQLKRGMCTPVEHMIMIIDIWSTEESLSFDDVVKNVQINMLISYLSRNSTYTMPE